MVRFSKFFVGKKQFGLLLRNQRWFEVLLLHLPGKSTIFINNASKKKGDYRLR